MQKLCLISFLMVFTLGLISAGFTTHSFGCSAIDGHRIQSSFQQEDSANSPNHGEIINISTENGSAKQEPLYSPDCGCPAHRVHCCDSLVMLDKMHRPQFTTSISARKYFELSHFVKQAPHLEGPFQPPTA